MAKSPAIICDDYPLRKAAERVLFVKYFNAGQICTTIDHIYIPEDKVKEFTEMSKGIVTERYPHLSSPDSHLHALT